MPTKEKRTSHVTREYIAEKLEIKVKMLAEHVHNGKVKLPPVAFKKRNTMYYAIDLADKFIASKPLDKANMLACEGKKPKRPQLDNGLVLGFIKPKQPKADNMSVLAAKHCRNERAVSTMSALAEKHCSSPKAMAKRVRIGLDMNLDN